MVKKLKALAKDDDKQLANAVRNSAQQIWQAGLGAFAKAQEEGGRVFSKLVKEGTDLQKRTRSRAEEKVTDVRETVSVLADGVSNKAAGSWDKLEQVFEERVARALGSMGVPNQKDIEALNKRIEQLSKLVAELSGKKTDTSKPAAKASGKAAAKPAAKAVPKAAAAKPAAKTAAKPAAKTAAKPAVKPAVKPATKTAAKPVAKTAVKPATKTAAKPVAKTAAKPAVKTAAKPAAKSAATAAAKPAAKAAAKATGKPVAAPAPAAPISLPAAVSAASVVEAKQATVRKTGASAKPAVKE